MTVDEIPEICEEKDTLTKISKGIEKLHNIVSVTLGPKGKSVILHKIMDMPVITKDGVSVANSISLRDPLEQIGVNLTREIANNVVKAAGDGTTTSCILTHNLLKNSIKYLDKGMDVNEIRKGMNLACADVVEFLKSNAIPVENETQLKNVATISVNNDEELGDIIGKALAEVGAFGSVVVGEGRTDKTELDLVEGFKVRSGYSSPYFVNNPETGNCELDKPLFLCASELPFAIEEFMPVLEYASKKNRSLVIVSTKMDDATQTTLVTNFRKKSLRAVFLKAPGFGRDRDELIGDIAAVTGSYVFCETDGFLIKNFTPEQLGEAENITLSQEGTVILKGAGTKVELKERELFINRRAEKEKNGYRVELLKRRITDLYGKVCFIKIGAKSETEAKEKKDRIEDALGSTKSAQRMGITVGGGVALLNSSIFIRTKLIDLSDEINIGYKIMAESLESPFLQLAKNCGVSGEVILNKYLSSYKSKPNYGYNFKTDKFSNLMKDGIIDPVEVQIVALENSVSVVSTLLTTGGVVMDINGMLREGY